MTHGVVLKPEGDMVVKASRKGPFEPDSMALWLGRCSPEAVVMDVGAYTGLYAIAAAKRGATVVALEPNPVAYQRMQENLGGNPYSGRVIPLMAAAGATWGVGRFAARFPLSSAGRLGEAGALVPVIPLDCWEGRIDALKVDVEGDEVAVLKGAARLIEQYRPLLILEALNDAARGRLDAHLEPLGYRGAILDERNMAFRGEAW